MIKAREGGIKRVFYRDKGRCYGERSHHTHHKSPSTLFLIPSLARTPLRKLGVYCVCVHVCSGRNLCVHMRELTEGWGGGREGGREGEGEEEGDRKGEGEG